MSFILKGLVDDKSAKQNKLVIFDIDDTLVYTQTKVHVIKDGQIVTSLNSHDFTHYKLKPGESFDFGDFRNAREFFDNSKPNIPMMNQLKRDINTGNKVVMVTARADFDDKELFLDTFRKFGVDINKVHVYRAGNSNQGTTEERKKLIIKKLLNNGKYDKAIMYDDAKPNLHTFMELKKEHPETRFYAWHVSLDGNATEYMREQAEYQGVGKTLVSEDDESTGMEWEEKLMDAWAPYAAKYMAKVVKQAFNTLYPDVKLKVWAEAEGVSATTDLTSDDVKADVFGQYGKKDWECNFFCGPLYNEADDRKYLELMVDDAASGSYPGVWKIIVSEWKRWATSQLKKTGADDVCFSVNEDMSGGAWGKIANAVGIKFIAHDLDEGVAEGEQMSKSKALNALRKQLMNEYPYMKCENLEEFKQRLQWLSEGMLKNHLTNDKNYIINQEEIALYQEYRKKREHIQQGSQGVAEELNYDREPLYHATLKAFEPSIIKSGLLPGGNLRMFDWSDKKYVYLSNYPDIARDFVDPGVIEPSQEHEDQIFKLMKQGGVIFKIDQNKLDRKLLMSDPHFQSDADDGAETYVYSGIIPPSAIIGKEYFRIDESVGVEMVLDKVHGMNESNRLYKYHQKVIAEAEMKPSKAGDMAKQIAQSTNGIYSRQYGRTHTDGYGRRSKDPNDYVRYQDKDSYDDAMNWLETKGKKIYYRNRDNQLRTAIQIGRFIVEPRIVTQGPFSDNPITTYSVSVRSAKAIGSGGRTIADITDQQAAALHDIAISREETAMQKLQAMMNVFKGEEDLKNIIDRSKKIRPDDKAKLDAIIAGAKNFKDFDEGISESNRLYKYHQKLRKQAGLPDPQEYLRMRKQKLIELILLNDPNQELNVLELATIPELEEIYQMVKKVDEDNTYQFAAEKTPVISPYAGVKDSQFRGAIGEGIRQMFEEPNQSPTDAGYQEGGWRVMNKDGMNEDLRKWFKEKWVRFGPDGKIRGACARGDDSEGKPKCLPQSKAHSLGKKGRASAAARKRREDPNPERSGKAINVATKKKKSNEGSNMYEASDISGLLAASHLNKSFIVTAITAEGQKKKFRVKAQNERVAKEKFLKHHSMAKILNVKEANFNESTNGNDSKSKAVMKIQKMLNDKFDANLDVDGVMGDLTIKSIMQFLPKASKSLADQPNKNTRVQGKQEKENIAEEKCPHCSGPMFEMSLMNEKKDACYYKVKSRYKVWPSAYASGALVKCRKKGAKNWGTKSESSIMKGLQSEGQIYSTGGGAGQAQRYYTPKDNLGEEQLDELKCWPGYKRKKGVKAGAPGSCEKI